MGICRRAGSAEIYRPLCGSTVCHIRRPLSLGSAMFHWLYISLWNVSQKKCGRIAASAGPVHTDKSAGFIRGSNWFWKQTTHTDVTSTTKSSSLLQKWPSVYSNPLLIQCSSAHTSRSIVFTKSFAASVATFEISNTHSDVLRCLRQICVQAQPTGVGFAAERQHSLVRRMLWHSGFPRT